MSAPPSDQILNPAAPSALSQFAFLIGSWRCEAKLQTQDGHWESFQAIWVGRTILDGHAIMDEYTMTNSAGAVTVHGMNFRSYDTAKQTWIIKWLNALTGAWTDLAPSDFGRVTVDGPSISYAFKEPSAAHAYTRATYTKTSATHFTWRGEQSADGHDWREFMIVACYRSAT
jgi:hypothetical protein